MRLRELLEEYLPVKRIVILEEDNGYDVKVTVEGDIELIEFVLKEIGRLVGEEIPVESIVRVCEEGKPVEVVVDGEVVASKRGECARQALVTLYSIVAKNLF